MAIKLHSLKRWETLVPGSAVIFDHGTGYGERRVRLSVNCQRETVLMYETEDGEDFLAVAPAGLETVEFSVAGKVAVFAADPKASFKYQTAELEPTHSEVVDPRIFTKIANRRHRNPELEEIMMRMNRNMEMRMAEQAKFFEQALERRRQEEKNGQSIELVKTDAPGATPVSGIGKLPQEGEPVQTGTGEAASEGEGSPNGS